MTAISTQKQNGSKMKQRLYVLAVNAGSSSVKASVVDHDRHVVSFLAERLGSSSVDDAILNIVNNNARSSSRGDGDESARTSSIDIRPDSSSTSSSSPHAAAVDKILEWLEQNGVLEDIVAVGHRVVHGGTVFDDSIQIDSEKLKKIEELSYLAPL